MKEHKNNKGGGGRWMTGETGFDSLKGQETFHNIQTGSGSYPSHVQWVPGGGGLNVGAFKLTSHLHAVPRLRMTDLHLHFHCMLMTFHVIKSRDNFPYMGKCPNCLEGHTASILRTQINEANDQLEATNMFLAALLLVSCDPENWSDKYLRNAVDWSVFTALRLWTGSSWLRICSVGGFL
jgi:hypothetical protein